MIIKKNVCFTPKGAVRCLHIYLPDEYDRTNERYPVMYFFDGHNLFSDHDATYGKCWGLKEFLDSWHKRMIIVGIECSHEGNERLSEYCPYDYTGSFLGEIKGTGRETLLWIARELKPDIDREYRTWPFREATGIGGSSMGGLMSVYAAAAFNQVFSKAACLSSTIGPGMNLLLPDIAEAPLNPDTRVYLSWGEKEAYFGRKAAEHPVHPLITRTAKNNYIAAELFRQKGCTAEVFFQPGGEHCEADWEKQVPEFMDFLWTR